MIRVQFNNKKIMYEAEFSMASESVVKLSSKNIKNNTSGFKVYRLNGDFLGDYSNFTKCTESDEGFIFEKV